MKEIYVTFQTITPLHTGDVQQKTNEIRPSSLMGSLRFWFEVICYFRGIVDSRDFNPKTGRFEKEVDYAKFKKLLQKEKKINSNAKINILVNMGIPAPSIVFGTTGWKSMIEIKDITPIEDYCFGNRLNISEKISIPKNNDGKGTRKNPSDFYLKIPYFWGKFNVTFRVEEEILEDIFLPLLNFMKEYGFWGGRWNTGYGRLSIEKIEIKNEKNKEFSKGDEFTSISIEEVFKFNRLSKSSVKTLSLEDIIETVNEFSNLYQNSQAKNKQMATSENEDKSQIKEKYKSKILLYFPSDIENSSFKNVIENLIKIKCKERPNVTHEELRHRIFGSIKRHPRNKEELSQGSKILPYIYKEGEKYKGGFLSISGLLNL